MSRTPLSWEPARDGDRFCAPACGRGCTHDEYKKAVNDAKALADQLGPDWSPEVWENGGWHYRATSPCGRWKVSPSYGGAYTAFIGERGPGGIWVGNGKTPAKAIEKALEEAQDSIARLSSYIDNPPAFLADKRGR